MVVAFLLLLGCWGYSILAIIAALQYRHVTRIPIRDQETGISILKPLAGLDEGLEDNLRSYFEQDYRNFELIFAVRQEHDHAAALAKKLRQQYPSVHCRMLITGDPPYLHDKVYKLQCMLDAAKHELVVMSDSDVRVSRSFCKRLAAEFQDKAVHLQTCPYRSVAGTSLWSKLEALSMNTDFHSGLFAAVVMEGATKFAVGPTIAARKKTVESLGGMERFREYVSSEDFMLGNTASAAGFGVRLSSYVVEHRIGSETIGQNFSHRLRWARTTRRSRPWGYIGQFFTFPGAAMLCLCLALPHRPLLFVVTAVLRVLLAWVVSEKTLQAKVPWLLLPLQDLLTFGFWIAGFFGNTVKWRGQSYLLKRDGTLMAN